MDGEIKTEVKIEIKTEPEDVINSLKDEEPNADEYVIPPKRFRRNQGIFNAAQ